MVQYVVYGKIIVDEIRAGGRLRSVLGGGGPQAAFGARLWSDSVGFLSRSGGDLAAEHVEALRALDLDLTGWRRFPAIPTPRCRIRYDAEEYLADGGLLTRRDDWTRLLSQPLTLPAAYRAPRAIHLVTEFPDEPMVDVALDLRRRGAIVSLEPLPIGAGGADWERMLALIGKVDLVTPDWPTASAIAGADDPRRVIDHWSALGPRAVAVRHGARGSYVWTRDRDEAWHVPAVPTEVVDPTGAGNAFGGGLCVGWTESGEARLAGCYGAIAASILVRQVGLPCMSAALRREAAELIEPTMAATRRL